MGEEADKKFDLTGICKAYLESFASDIHVADKPELLTLMRRHLNAILEGYDVLVSISSQRLFGLIKRNPIELRKEAEALAYLQGYKSASVRLIPAIKYYGGYSIDGSGFVIYALPQENKNKKFIDLKMDGNDLVRKLDETIFDR